MQFTTPDGVALHYLDEGKGLPVLLLHAFPLSSMGFRPQLQLLSNKYRLIVPDQRGFGKSSLGAGPTEMSTLARDALALLDHLKIPSAVVGGVSMGGYASMALLRLDPARVKALVLVDTRAIADDEAGKKRREETAQSVLKKGMGVLVESMLTKLVSPAASETLRAEVESIIRSNPPQGAAAALLGMALRQDSQDILARYAGPALVVVGDKDELTPPERSLEMHKLLAKGSLVILPGAGHLSNLEAPVEFNRALDAFIASSVA
jgi:pimeloyl-ACP methyl ester carboxylesterase